MNRQIRASEIFLLMGLGFIFLFMLIHDWVPLGRLNDVDAVLELQSVGELIGVTLIGTVQILFLMGMLLFFIGRTYPLWVKLWLIIHQGCILAGAMLSWWVPYLFGIGAEDKVERYRVMFGNTHSFLPIKNGIVPNTIHVMFHFILLMCVLITIYISFTRPKYGRGHVQKSYGNKL